MALTHEKLVELAFAVFQAEPLTENQQYLLDRLRADADDAPIFRDYVRILRDMNSSLVDTNTGDVDEELIAAYVDGMLSDDNRDRAEILLAHSSRARRLLLELLAVLRDIQTPGTPHASALTYVVQLARGCVRMLCHPEAGFILRPPQPVLVLGPAEQAADKTCAWRQQVGTAGVDFRLTGADEGRAHLAIDFPPFPEAAHWQVTLYASSDVLQSESVSCGGHVVFNSLRPDCYRIELAPPGAQEPVSLVLDLQTPDQQ